MDVGGKRIEAAPSSESERREREIQLLMNVIEPDPEYQAFFITDDATALDVSGVDVNLVERRLCFYLGGPLPVPITAPLWQLVDAVKATRPEWPEE